MKWNSKEPYVPTRENGDWLSWPPRDYNIWELVFPFEDILEVTGITSGQSSKVVNLKSVSNGICYPMFVVDFVEAIKAGTLIEDGKISAKFAACKRGQNYGIKIVS